MNRPFSIISALLSFFAVLYFTSVSPPRAVREPESEEQQELKSGRSGALEALEFWTASRAYPNNDISSETYYHAFFQSKKKFKEHRRSPFGGYEWKFIGPTNLSGRTIALALNPVNGKTLYAGSASGGLWRSYTGGVGGNWKRVTTGFPVLGVNAIAINPLDTNTMYIGTGEVYRFAGAIGGTVIRTTRGSYGIGILKTTDNGETWTHCLDFPLSQQEGIQVIKINPLNPNTVWAGATSGTYKSTDGGLTWTMKLFSLPTYDLLIHPTDTNSVLASCGNFGYGAGVFRSSDGGEDWDLLLLPLFTGKTMLAMYASQPDTVFASIAESTNAVGSIWRSYNFGLTWSQIADIGGSMGVQGWYSHYVAVHPTNPNIILNGAVNMTKTVNGGSSFSNSNGTYSDHHTYAIHPLNPNIIYDANDDGVYRSTNFGSSFTSVSNGYTTGQFYNGFSNSTTDSLLSIGQVQDHIPGYKYTGNDIWTSSAIDEVGWTAITPGHDSIMFAVYREGSSVYRSTNRGTSFSRAESFGGIGSWCSPIAVSNSNPAVVYFGRDKIYKSNSYGEQGSWFATNSNTALDGNPALCIAIAPSDENVVYVGTAPLTNSPHLFRTTDGGETWQNVTGTLPNRYPNDAAVNPVNPAIAYIAFGGFGEGHFYKTTDYGNTWANISGTLPDVPGTAVLVDPLSPNTVYAGNDIGVYISTDAGATWNGFSDGLPEAILVSDITYSASNRSLRVATHGNGVFDRKLPATFPAVSLSVPNGGESWEGGILQEISWTPILLETVTLEYTTDNGTTWELIADSIPASPSRYEWETPLISSNTVTVRIRSGNNPAVYDASESQFTIYFFGTSVSLTKNWNLISIPVITFDTRVTTIFPTATSSAFSYDSGYVQNESLTPGIGYWLKVPAAKVFPIIGDSISTDTIDVHEGWNLIGTITKPVSVSSIITEPPSLAISDYYKFENGYIPTPVLEPGKGYWVKVYSSGKLVLSPASFKQLPEHVSVLEGAVHHIRIKDSNGYSQTLYFSSNLDTKTLTKYQLPPSPPEGIVDIRFASGQFIENIDANARQKHAITLRSVAYPVTVFWDIRDEQTVWELSTSSKHLTMSGTGNISFATEESIQNLQIQAQAEVEDVPVQTRLLQNFPNPFNPSTSLSYDLSVESRVTLKIFSLLGKEIDVPIQTTIQRAGNHTVVWDAANYPAGIYLVQLTVNDATFSRKIAYIK